MLREDFTRREPGAIPLREPFQIGDHALGSEIVRVPQRPAAEGGKAKSEDGADVTIARVPDDGLTECPCRLVHDREHEPLQNLGGARTATWEDAGPAEDASHHPRLPSPPLHREDPARPSDPNA